MKRILSVVLVLCILLSFAACEKEKEPTAYDLVNSAVKKTQALNNLDMNMIMKMSMAVEGVSIDVPVEYDIKAVDVHSNNPKLAMTMSLDMVGMAVDMDFYMEDGYYYVSAMGQNFKFKAEPGDDYDALGQASDLMVNLDEKYLNDTKIITNSNGSKTVKLEMDSDTFKKVFKELIDSTGEDAAEGATIKDISISNAAIEITVDKEGYIDIYKVKFDMSIAVDVMGTSDTITVKLDAGIKYNNPGKDVTVTAPAGYKNYPEVDPDALG